MKNGIPAEGVHGAADIRLTEASSTEFRQLIQLLNDAVMVAWRARLGRPSTDIYVGVYVESVFPDRLVVQNGGRYWQHTWTIDAANQVVLGEPVEVVEQYMPVTMREASNGEGTFLEAVDKDGTQWDVVLIRAGLSHNGNFYSDAVLREAAPLFEGVRAFVKSDEQHVNGGGKDVRQLVGWFADVKFVEGKSPDAGRILARFNVSAAEDKLRTKMVDAWNRGKRNLVGLSIDAVGKAKVALREGKKVRVAESITKVKSVDVIVDASAGGEFIRLVEAEIPQEEKSDMKLRESMVAKVKQNAKVLAKYPDPDKLDDEQLEAAYREAITPETPAAPAKDAPAAVTAEDLRMVEAKINGRTKIATCGLPAPAVKRLLAEFEGRARFTEADVDVAIKDEREYLAKFTESGHVVLAEGDISIEDRSKKIADMFDAFFDPKHKDHEKVSSFKECYVEMTGDKHVTGRLENVDRARFAESTGVFRESMDSTTLANVLGNSITRAMLREYRSAIDYDAWQKIASVVSLSDFRTQERTMMGGYGDLPIVEQGAPYTSLASPADWKATYAARKRGGTEDLTLEMIKNDDSGVISRIPVKLGRTAKRTLAKFVFDFVRTNPAIYDGDAFFHVNHNNLLTAALDAGQVSAHRLLMMKQTELSSADRIGIPPKFLLVPSDLQETAANIWNRSTNNDKTFIQTQVLEILPIWYWTDVTDWATFADPLDIPTLEIGFLDGQREPSLFVQDNPTVGSMFSNDKLTYKIRHIYGGNVTDYRGATKAVVAG